MRIMLALLGLVMLSGCVSTAATIITAPVRAVGRVADLATTSQSESDENRGRAMRHREEQMGRLQRELERADRKCQQGDDDACDSVESITEEMGRLCDNPTPR